MRAFIGFTKRNLRVFFSDRQTIFFSMLTPIIVLSLYLLFLSDNYTKSVEHSLQQVAATARRADIKAFVNGILLTGILGTEIISIPFHTLTTMVHDRERRIDNDVLATPMKRGVVVLGYFIAAVAATVIMGSIVAAVGIGVMVGQGLPLPSLSMFGRLFLTLLLGAFSSTALFMLLLLLIKTEAAAGAISGIVSAVSGFVIGAYMPISAFGKGIQTVCNLFPATGITVLFRDILTMPAINRLADALPQARRTQFVEEMRAAFGYELQWGGHGIGRMGIVIFVSAGILLCLGLLVLIYSGMYRKK
ncbi:MAG: ABC transporter permease [Lachnospiraceae bacterium]|nr:ABC transporter permease [Lachnospiraceae bacterium]MDY5742352.1 ABC transporter permease [Lachnospiraceae bacterium]